MKITTFFGLKEQYNSTVASVVQELVDHPDFTSEEIAKALDREGLRTGTGQRWGRTTVHKVLTNEAYCGTLVLGGRPGHPAVHSGVPPVRVENAWPAIIDKDTFFRYKR